jgi:hypothetical protein
MAFPFVLFPVQSQVQAFLAWSFLLAVFSPGGDGVRKSAEPSAQRTCRLRQPV